ncbi:uncharacterized protein [Argopecten irradians]|uniref:uncharacterized protein n=1 Tax=Argopecten irradians TaxID=31199 RepID=UPI00371CB4DE
MTMILRMTHPLCRLFQPGSAQICRRSFSFLRNVGPFVPCSAIPHSAFCADVVSPFHGVRQLHISHWKGSKRLRPFCQPHCGNNWLSSGISSDTQRKEWDVKVETVNVLNCQQGQQILKDFLMEAALGGKEVSGAELVKTLDAIIAAVYSDGNYPFKAICNMFQNNSFTGQRGLSSGNTGIAQLFHEQSLLKDFFSCAEIEPLLSLINERLPTMTVGEKAHVFLCLNYLGIQEVYTNHPVIHKLFFTLNEPTGHLCFEDLRKFQMVLETYCNRDVVKYQYLLPHIKHLNSVGYLTGLEKQQFVRALSFCNTVTTGQKINLHRWVGEDIYPRIFPQIWYALVTDETVMKCPENILTILVHLCDCNSSNYHIPKIIRKDIFDRIEKKLIEHLELGNMSLLVRISSIKNYLDRRFVSKRMQLKFVDQWETFLHTKTSLNAVEMLSVMTMYRLHYFCLSSDSLGILTRIMEENFKTLHPTYSIHFVSMLGWMLRQHRSRGGDLSHFSKLLYLINTPLDAGMFQNSIVFLKLLLKWKLHTLSPDAFKMYVELNLLFRNGFGRNSRWLPIALDCLDSQPYDTATKKKIKERMSDFCKGETDLVTLLHICLHLIEDPSITKVSTYIDSSKHIVFYRDVLNLINAKINSADLKDLTECFSADLSFRLRRAHRYSVYVQHTISDLIGRVSEVLLVPHPMSDAVKLGEAISHHYYHEYNEFFQLTTAAVDQLVTNLLKEEQTCGLDGFIALTNLFASGQMSRSKIRELEVFVDILYEENIDSMKIDSLLLGLDNLCLAGVFPKKTLKAVLSSDFLDVVDQCIDKKSQRVVSVENVEYHLLRLNRSVVLHCPELDIPWFCGHVNVDQKHRLRYLIDYCEETKKALCRVLGGRMFVSVNSTTRLKHVVDFQCFVTSHGHPIQPDLIDLDKPLPVGVQKVAIDILPDSLWGDKPDVIYQEKQRQLEKEGYNYIQVKRDSMRGLALTQPGKLEEFYTGKIFG